MQEIEQNLAKNGDKHEVYQQVDVTGGRGPIGRHRPAPSCASSPPCHVSNPWHHHLNQSEASTWIIDQRPRCEALELDGPLVIHLELHLSTCCPNFNTC
jgi:hypothetical protein